MKKIYIPSNLDLQKILPEEYSEKELDKFYYLIHLIYEQRILYKNPEDFIPLKAEYLRTIIRNYNYYRNILIDKNIIECDGRFIKGVKSMGYRLMPPYSGVKHKQILLKNKRIIENIEKWRKRRLPTTKVHMHLYDFLTKVEIDHPSALSSISGLPVEEYNPCRVAIDKFLNKEFFLYSDEYGRVHTNITSLKSSLRKYLTFQGKKLVNVDIINSQPLFLLLIPSILPTIRCTFSNCFENNTMDIFKYKSFVEHGELYEYLMREFGFEDRRQFKEAFFRDVFFGKKVPWQRKVHFDELFPTVAKILDEVKKDDYKSLAWMMQRAESNLIITQICGRLMDEHKDCFISTIHDSILTTVDQADKIERIMKQEFQKLGILPSIRVESA